jgi:hypothetical protein
MQKLGTYGLAALTAMDGSPRPLRQVRNKVEHPPEEVKPLTKRQKRRLKGK